MIEVCLNGGLGNQMFQYATAKRLALHHNVKLVLNCSAFKNQNSTDNFTPRNFELQLFNIRNFELKLKDNTGFLQKFKNKLLGTHYYYEKDLFFDADVLNLPKHSVLEGYFQSEKYFRDIREVLLQEFDFIKLDNTDFLRIARQMQSNNSVAVHVRRGDFANKSAINSVHGTISMEYYKNAFQFIKNQLDNPLFFLFSDDLEWAVQHLNEFVDIVPVQINVSNAHLLELKLMTLAKANIIANSSFSWWGAWLNQYPNKIIFAPEKWYSNPTKQSQTSDLIPFSWKKIAG